MDDYTVAIDVGGSKLLAARVGPQGQLDAVQRRKTPVQIEARALISQLGGLTEELMVPGAPAAALGIGLPGTVEAETGQCWCAPNLGWLQVDAAGILRERLGIPVFMDNDANAAAVAEHRLGAGRGSSYLLVITMGTGIGAGLILDGHLYRGAHGSAGELGHVPWEGGGQLCNCGNQGCLETAFSAPALTRLASQAYGSTVRARELITRATGGETKAIDLLQEAIHPLIQTLVGVVNLLDLQLIVLGGGLAAAGELVRRPIAQALVDQIMPRPGPPIQVRLAQCGPQAGVIGAGLIAWEGLLS